MSVKAIDIVLLPSESVMDKAIEMNRLLVEKYGSEIVFNKVNHLQKGSSVYSKKNTSCIGAFERRALA